MDLTLYKKGILKDFIEKRGIFKGVIDDASDKLLKLKLKLFFSVH